MKRNTNFSPEQLLTNIDARLLLSLQRLSDMLKAMQWEQARMLGITPLQLQILLFVGYHPPVVNKAASIASELQVSRPTISDAVGSLVSKGLLEMHADKRDRRSYSLVLTGTGMQLMKQASEYMGQLKDLLDKKPEQEKNNLYHSVYSIITGLLTADKGGVQRMCFNCAHYNGNKKRQHECLFLKKSLLSAELQLDCSYHSTLS
ncbi:DNA-binding transcriptional regulator, MarR family [Chitinophaga sp. CF118]|uniref:MarR family winged helix-turn-helix transcriptional regulator n=1 Tax=Chitinophaga sp. CF118 TaxID=1884367 RepID=UPI0008E6D07F|nr:helix-turn-helix domain-containing protein [Chitinophaga sp. CF118]SFF03098.1 DNA-binding transcriptional regulator, MarR family [Chitinophaga sp. CF118]